MASVDEITKSFQPLEQLAGELTPHGGHESGVADCGWLQLTPIWES